MMRWKNQILKDEKVLSSEEESDENLLKIQKSRKKQEGVQINI